MSDHQCFFIMLFWVKETVSRDFRHFFYQNTLPGPHRNKQKRFCEIFHFREDIRE